MFSKFFGRAPSSPGLSVPPPSAPSIPSIPPTPTSPSLSPTRAHWVPLESAQVCAIKTCKLKFGWLDRKHNCARCGKVVCTAHFGSTQQLDEHAVPSPSGKWCEVCDECILVERRRALREREGDTGGSTTVSLALPMMPEGVAIPDEIGRAEDPIFLLSIITHLGEQLQFVDRVHRVLGEFRDSTLRQAYMDTEKAAFLQAADAVKKHVELLTDVVQTPAYNLSRTTW